MTILPNDGRMKPILIIPPGQMSPADIKELRANGICVVEAKDPALVKFLDPIPSAAERTRTEDAAIELSRMILNKTWNPGGALSHGDACNLFVSCLVKGTRLDKNGTRAEQEQRLFDDAKAQEIRRCGQEEGAAEWRAKREAKKKAKADAEAEAAKKEKKP